MFQNDFEDVAGDSFPFHGWTVKVQDTSSTWKQYTYYNWKNEGNDSKHAYISNDWKGAQDEYLISPAVDLSGTRDGVLTFDFAYGEYGIKNKTFTATVEASTDGGKTWNAIWNFQDSYTGQQASNYIISGSAEVPVPAEYNVDGVQFAFRYVHPNEDTTGQLAIDNVKLMAVEDGPVAQKYTITATAGEGGSITPAGEVSVKEGASQTFAIAAQEGYAIADVLVDGQSVGAVDSYTFENVTANHTIAALFTKTASDVQFDNDFESETFPGHGWTLQSTRSDSPYTWYQGTNRNLNTTKQARIDMDYYEDPWGGGWSVGGIRKPLLPMAGGSDKLQDEYLISPVVNLTGKTPTLSFDYLLFKSVIGNYCSVTVEATTDGGQTWTTIWTAADLEPVSGYWFMGTANVAVPAAFCTDNAQFAFHFYKKANQGYDDTDAMFAIDNVTMTYGATDPCAGGHTLTAVAEVPATCEETGVKAHWVCSVCGKLFSDAEGKNETTLEALTISTLQVIILIPDFHTLCICFCLNNYLISVYAHSQSGIQIVEVFRIGKNHSSLRNNLIIFPCLITYIFIKTVNLGKFDLIHPYSRQCRYFQPLFFLPQNCGICLSHCPFHQNPVSIQRFIGHIQTDGFFKFKMLTVHIRFHCHPALFFTGKHYRRKESLRIIMKRFPASVIING